MDDFKHLTVKFYSDKVINKAKTAEAKRPIFDDQEKVEIRQAGDPKSTFVAPAHDQSSVHDKQTGARLTYAQLHEAVYEAWKKNAEATTSGTMVALLDSVTPAKAGELKALNVHTVEQLANLDGAGLARLGMQAQALKTEAVEYLAKAEKMVNGAALMSENDELRKEMAELKAAMANQVGAAGQDQDEPTEGNPFEDWPREDLKSWYDDNGGGFDAKWNVDRARKMCNARNKELENKAA